MPHCPHCQATYIVGEVYCPICGQSLPAPTLWPPRAPEPSPRPPDAAQPLGDAQPGQPQALRLLLPSGAIIDLIGREQALIGRKDGESTPDIDLAPYGAAEKGVSRQHAMIVLDAGQYH